MQLQQIVPYVEDRKNALLFTPEGEVDDAVMADLQYAIVRGLEVAYQLEEGEVLGEALPERSDRRSILIYEAAEGGAGVLSQIVSQAGALAGVMAKAMENCHFDVERFKADGKLHDVADAKCVAGCYRCLLSYYNQPDHSLVDRRKDGFKLILARLARSQVDRMDGPQPAPVDDPSGPIPPLDPLLAAIVARGLAPCDAKPIDVGGVGYPYVWRAIRVVAAPAPMPIKTSRLFADKGLMVVTFDPKNPAAPETIDALAEALGEAE